MRFRGRIILFVLLLFVSVTQGNAQLCPGSLGDPIINRTFGSGANPGASLSAATTNYVYAATDCPNDGFYTVRSNTIGCFGNSWHNLFSDHTGDFNGHFMLVNASVQPGAFYLDTVKGLCGGTTYEFAAWVINVLLPFACNGNGERPNLTFTLERTDGTVVQSYNSGLIPQTLSPTWRQFGFFFMTPTNVTDVVLRIVNNAPGGCGNDLALDDITFRACGPQIQSRITGQPLDSVVLCQGKARSFTFDATVSAGYNNPSYQWQQRVNGGPWTDIAGAISTSLSRNFPASTAAGIYSFRLAAAEAGNLGSPQCRVVSSPLVIQVAVNPVPAPAGNSPICANSNLQLTAKDGLVYSWTGPSNFTASSAMVTIPNVQTNQSGKYYVVATNLAGCSAKDSITISINPSPVAVTSFSEVTICEGKTVQLQSSGGTTYAWKPLTGLSSAIIPDPNASPKDTIVYQVIISNQFACHDTATIKVNVIERPVANAGPDRQILKGNSVQLLANAVGQNLTYTWTPAVFINSTTILQPVVSPPRDTTYILSVKSGDGCGIDTDTVKIFVYKDVYVPNAFTPNGDGLNDTWNIPALSVYPDFELSVFNRYGQLVFQNRKVNRPWDGKFKGVRLPVGAYVYMIDLKQGGKLFKGTVLLLR
jgi:gliding motility-associated-like protein